MSAPKISLSLAAGRKPPVAPTNGVKRSRAIALQDDEDDSHEQYGRAHKVSHFDHKAGGAFDSEKKKDDLPLVIARQANRDWKEAAQQKKSQRNVLRRDGHGGSAQAVQVNVLEQRAAEEKPNYGLNVFSKDTPKVPEPVLADVDTMAQAVEIAASTQEVPPEPQPNSISVKERTEDEVALDALLGRTVQDQSLVLPNQPTAPMTETDAFRQDFSSAPPMSSLDDYARVPVEQFGAALLRGMGWKDGEGIGSQRGKKIQKQTAKPQERRPALLGIGAKDDAAITQEIGAWGKAAKGAKGEVKIYNPVLLRDKKTGELFTEEELQRKQEREERKRYEDEFDRKENDRKKRQAEDDDLARREQGGRERRRDDGHRRDRDSERESTRDRDCNKDRDRDRDRRRHEESDDEYYRRKERERRRRHERDYDERNGRSHEKEDSRRHESYDDRSRRKSGYDDGDRHRARRH